MPFALVRLVPDSRFAVIVFSVLGAALPLKEEVFGRIVKELSLGSHGLQAGLFF